MKKLLCLFILCLSCYLSYAQADRTNNAVIRINYNTNIYNSYSSRIGHNYTPGFAIDLGAKQFLVKDKGWFLEEVPSFLFNDLPFAKSSREREKTVMPYSRLRELGAGASVVFGYDFLVGENSSIAVFAGPDFRYIFQYYPTGGYKGDPDYRLHKGNLRVRFGAAYNYNKLNINLFISPDLLDRGLGIKRYRTVQVGLGIGYYFK